MSRILTGMALWTGPVPRHGHDAARCVLGLGLTAAAALVADEHPAADRRLFEMVNDHESDLPAARLVQQLGTPWILPGTAVTAALAGRRRLALAAALALPVEKALEVGIKKLRPTPRPLYVQPTVLRDDAAVEGESFPSGHAAIAFTAVGLVAPLLPFRAAVLTYVLAGGTALVRISQGAHHPIDSVAGASLGLGIASGLTFVVGRDQT